MRESLTGAERRVLLSDLRVSNELSYIYRRLLESCLIRADASDDEVMEMNVLMTAVIAAQVRLNATINELAEEVEPEAVKALLPKEILPLNDEENDPDAEHLRQQLLELADSLAPLRHRLLSLSEE